ncbi:DAK2 domain-containing protein [Oerskovia sp. NPDC060338]|uniref:DAK2 domain-containing protein n=1 Tax=Oerskovia sp. NPDC060338 TaxID=3347100 RepID=UPI0036652B5C
MTDGKEHIEPAVVRAWVTETVRTLGEARARIDSANVFPVADADTGTNMLLTVTEGARAVAALPDGEPTDSVLVAFARGALLGARGNSGVILSEFLRGFAGAVTSADQPVGSLRVATRFEAAARASYAAVAAPVPGTILTAASGGASAARAAADAGADLTGVVVAARDGSHRAMLRSPSELEVLSRAGVRDAGAFGLVLVLDALCRVLGADGLDGAGLEAGVTETSRLGGAPVVVPGHGSSPASDVPAGPVLPALPTLSVAGGTMDAMATLTTDASVDPRARAGLAVGHADPSAGPSPALTGGDPAAVGLDGEFEVMFVVESVQDGRRDAPDLAAALRTALQEVGDSVVVVGDGVWQAHVHTDDPGRAVAAARQVAAGRAGLRQVCVRHLATQVAARGVHEDPSAAAPHPEQQVPAHGVVAITSAPGLVPDLARSGAVVLLAADRAPEPEEVLRVAVDTSARFVTVLPGSAAAAVAARAAASRVEPGAGDLQAVEVLDAPTDLHVVAALAAAQLVEEDQAEAMRAALADVRAVQVAADGSLVRPALEDLLRPDDEVLTIMPGRGVDPLVIDVVVGIARQRVPGIEVVVLDSGRDHADLELGAE